MTVSIRRRLVASVVAAATIPTAALMASAPAQATATATTSTSCATGWGSLPESNMTMARGPLTAIRAGQHACFDRLVLDLGSGTRPGYDVRYVNNVYTDGEGRLVPLRGGAKLQVILRAPAYSSTMQPTYRPTTPSELVNVTGYRTFRQAAWAGSFEGQSTVGLGVRARLPFRAWTYTDANARAHLVIDVAHTW